MSIDKSLKLRSRLVRPRSVLSRAERLAELRESDRWQEGDSILGLPKVRVRRAKRRAKADKVEESPEAAAQIAEATAPSEAKGKSK